MHIHKIVYIKTFKIAPTCFDPKLKRGTVQLPEDDLRIETCWSDFKSFNINNFMYVH